MGRIREEISSLERRKAEDKNFDYGVHPLRCNCEMFLKHDGKKNLKFKDRVVYCHSAVIG